jgi:hypothetical protein
MLCQARQRRCGVGHELQNVPSHHRIERLVECHLCRIALAEDHAAQASTLDPMLSGGDGHWRRISPDNRPSKPDQAGYQYRDVAGSTADV